VPNYGLGAYTNAARKADGWRAPPKFAHPDQLGEPAQPDVKQNHRRLCVGLRSEGLSIPLIASVAELSQATVQRTLAREQARLIAAATQKLDEALADPTSHAIEGMRQLLDALGTAKTIPAGFDAEYLKWAGDKATVAKKPSKKWRKSQSHRNGRVYLMGDKESIAPDDPTT
jgi:hypothetical protein